MSAGSKARRWDDVFVVAGVGTILGSEAFGHTTRSKNSNIMWQAFVEFLDHIRLIDELHGDDTANRGHTFICSS